MNRFTTAAIALALSSLGLALPVTQSRASAACGGMTPGINGACPWAKQLNVTGYYKVTMGTTVRLTASAGVRSKTNPGNITNTAYARNGVWMVAAARTGGRALTITKVSVAAALDVDAKDWSLGDASVSVPGAPSVTLKTDKRSLRCFSPQPVAASDTNPTHTRVFSIATEPEKDFCKVTIGGFTSFGTPTFKKITAVTSGVVELITGAHSSVGCIISVSAPRVLG